MKNTAKQLVGLTLIAGVLLAGCGDGSNTDNASQTTSAQKETGGLSSFEKEHGIGPVTSVVELGNIDMEKVEKGKKLFKTKCSACHKIGERYVGPNLATVFEDRSPTYVMNMIMNPDGMVKKHPEAKKLLAEFLSPMPNQGLNQEETRAIIEYLASVQTESDSK